VKVAVREDVASALPLMENVLRDGRALAADYPLVFGGARSGGVVTATDAGEVLSTCAFLERTILFQNGTAKIGLIGSVSTAEAARGRGLASSVLECAENELRESGCLFSFLWADSPEFYAKRGYLPLGSERDYELPTSLAGRLPVYEDVREATAGDFAGMHSLYSKHRQRADRTPLESAALFPTPGMRVFVARAASKVEAYICFGRGDDLPGVVHEWAGETQAVLGCLRHLLEAEGRANAAATVFLMSPSEALPVTEQLDALGACSATGVLGMGKLLNLAAVAAEIAMASDVGITWRTTDSGACVMTNGACEIELSAREMSRMLLPAAGEREQIARVEEHLGARLNGLPWAPFLWGLDSI
jgi:predicted N-acetyltransferase YhbS